MPSFIIADDNPCARSCFRRSIESVFPNAEIDETDNGEDLVEYVKRQIYDLIVTDRQMYPLSGLEAVSRIRVFDRTTPIWTYSVSSTNKKDLETLGISHSFDKTNPDELDRFEKELEAFKGTLAA